MKNNYLKTKVFCLFMLCFFFVNNLFAQQAVARQELVIYKLIEGEYALKAKDLQTSFANVSGIELVKACSLYNKVFLMLNVDRNIHPDDTPIINKLVALSLSYKPINDASGKQQLLDSCN